MMTRTQKTSLQTSLRIVAVATLAGASATAGAQTPGSASGPAAPTTIQGGTGESLSSKLNKSGGVIAPKSDVDPGIRAQAPDPQPGAMPVIPPSATGGGAAK